MKKFAQKSRVRSESERKTAVNAVLKENRSVSEVARQLGVARKTIYSWVRTYKQTSPRNKERAFKTNYVSGKSHPRAIAPHAKATLLRLIFKNPDWGCRKLSQELKKRGVNLGYYGVNNLLNKLGVSTPDLRVNFKRLFSGPGRLEADIKLEIVNSVLLEKQKINKVAKEYGVARKTIYQWIKRHQDALERGLVGAQTLKEAYVTAEHHPRAIYPSLEPKLLDIVAKEPSLSVHNLAKRVPASSWTVWSMLKRRNLSFYKQRLAFSQAQSGSIRPVFTRFLDRVIHVLEQFIPTLAPAPPPAIKGLGKAPRNFIQSLLRIYSYLISLGSSRPTFYKYYQPFFLSTVIGLVLSLGTIYWVRFLGASAPSESMGLGFATVSLAMGSIFFAYSLKYYITLALVLSFSQAESEPQNQGGSKKKGFLSWILGMGNGGNGNGKVGKSGPVGLTPSLEHISLKKKPFVSIHIPFYNEKNVVKRAMEAATNFDYPEYEVILCDDSTDETTDIIRQYQKEHLFKGEKLKTTSNKKEGWTLTSVEVKPGVTLKHLHRTTRSGFKGGALKIALALVDPRCEFISVFDADFVPYPDTLSLFLKYFKVQNEMSEDYSESNVAVVQGYQWHVLNKSENWVTRGVRSEYAGSYVVERSGQEMYGGLKHISGSVYMIRRKPLEEVGWRTSITEDYELTLRLYEKGYKVVFTPYIQAPAECVSTLKRLIKQRMRWSEGHSHNVKLMSKRLLFNPKLTAAEKIEFLFNMPYYLQALLFLVGTLAWLISETVFKVRLPFWTTLWGWSLVLTNMLALPLMNAVGLFLEESEEKDYSGLGSFIALTYIMVPFQAYASVKGFLESEEGPWFRTPKTGHITDVFSRGKFYRFISGILPGRAKIQPTLKYAHFPSNLNQYLALTTANNRFDTPVAHQQKGRITQIFDGFVDLKFFSRNLRVARRNLVSKTFISTVLIFSLTVNHLAFDGSTGTPEVQAKDAEPGQTKLGEYQVLPEPIESFLPVIEEIANHDTFSYQAYTDNDNLVLFGLKDETNAVARIVNSHGKYLEFSFPGVIAGPRVEEERIVYEIPEGLFIWKIKASQLKEEIVLYERPTTGTFKIYLNYSRQLKVQQTEEKGYQIVDEERQETLFFVEKPTVKDADGNDGWIVMEVEEDLGCKMLDARCQIGYRENNQTIIKLKVGQRFLDQAKYPVTIDPTVDTNPSSPVMNIADRTNDPTSEYNFETNLPRGGGEISFGSKKDNSIGYKFETGDGLYNLEIKLQNSKYPNIQATRVEGNKIVYESGNLTTEFEVWTDRVKANYILKSKPISNTLDFDLYQYSMIPKINEDGSIALIGDDGYGNPNNREAFTFAAPTVEDAEGKIGKAHFTISDSLYSKKARCPEGDGECQEEDGYYDRTGTLAIVVDKEFLQNATYPVTIDPTTLATSTTTRRMYASGKNMVRMDNGTLAASYVGNSAIIYFTLSFDNGASWTAGNFTADNCTSSSDGSATATLNNELHNVGYQFNTDDIDYCVKGGDITFKTSSNTTEDQTQTNTGGNTITLNDSASTTDVVAQSFNPTVTNIDEVEIYIGTVTGTPDLNIEIRESKNNSREPDIDTAALATCTVALSSGDNGAFKSCTFSDTAIDAEKDYFILVYCERTGDCSGAHYFTIETRQPSGTDYSGGYNLFSIDWDQSTSSNWGIQRHISNLGLDISAGGGFAGLVIDKNNYPAVSWSYETSGGTKDSAVRFSRATGDPQVNTNWDCATGSSCGYVRDTDCSTNVCGDHIQPVSGVNSGAHTALVKAPSTATNTDELVIMTLWESDGDLYSSTATVNGTNYNTWTTTSREGTIDDANQDLSVLSVDDGTNQRIWVGWDDDSNPNIRLSYLDADSNNWTSSPTGSPSLTGNSPSLAYDAENGDIYVWAVDQSADEELIFRKYDISGTSWDSSDQVFDIPASGYDLQYPNLKVDNAPTSDPGPKLDLVYKDFDNSMQSPTFVYYYSTWHIKETRAYLEGSTSGSSIPVNDSDDFFYDEDDYTDSNSDNEVYVVGTTAPAWSAATHVFKMVHSNNTDDIQMTWNGQVNGSHGCDTFGCYLQIYHWDNGGSCGSAGWETVDSDSTVLATDFTLDYQSWTKGESAWSCYYSSATDADDHLAANTVAIRVQQCCDQFFSPRIDTDLISFTFIPEKVLWLLPLAIFMPKVVPRVVRLFRVRRRKEYAFAWKT